MGKVFSPIAIDCGAVNTGVFLSHEDQKVGLLIRIPDGRDDNLKLSQQSRTAKRHQQRGYKRRKLAKRLFRVILRDQYKIDFFELEENVQEFISGLFNRRGYSFFSSDEDNSEKLQEADLLFFTEYLGDFFTDDAEVDEQLSRMSNDLGEIGKLSASLAALKLSKDDDFFKDDPKRVKFYEGVIRELKDITGNILRADKEGHLPRKKYFENIKNDINSNDEILSQIYKTGLNSEKFYHLVCNISNLQLRVLRKYFNDPDMKNGDQWKPEKYYKHFCRYVRAWHPKSDQEKTARSEILNILKKTDSYEVLEKILASVDPVKTIPPYEDQNNRRPKKCQSLLFDESKLDRHYPDWQKYLVMASHIDTVSFNVSGITKSQLLQRIYDVNSKLDKDQLEIRRTVNLWDRISELTEDDKKALNDSINNIMSRTKLTLPEVQGFLRLGSAYYNESRMAATGDWFAELPSSILKRCDTNPPRKNKQIGTLLSGLLSFELSDDEVDECKDFLKTSKVRRVTLKGFAERCAKAQKVYGVNLKEKISSKEFVSKDKDLQSISDNLEGAGENLKQWIDDKRSSKSMPELDRNYADVFIFAQIYNLVFEDITGFSKTCRYCTNENAWRTKVESGQGHANAKRLPADSIRPFDGVLARAIDKIAWEITKAKKVQLESLSDGTDVLMPIILEMNHFEFSEEILTLKNKNKNKKLIEEKREQELVSFRDKFFRIADDGKNICPYTGKSIGDSGHIDHIIPRAYTKKRLGNIINSEANLIYASKEGNNKKADKILDIDDLHKNYLVKVFGTENISAIKEQILNVWDRVKKDRSMNLAAFHSFKEEERNAIRHILFMPTMRDEALRELDFKNKTKVNGIQKYLAQCISEKLRRELPNLNITTQTLSIDPSMVQDARHNLADEYKTFKKKYPQSVFSHIVDAAMLYATWETKQGVVLSPDYLYNMLPDSFKVEQVARKPVYRKTNPQNLPLFKDSYYGIHFVPFIVKSDGECGFGFTPGNFVKIEEAKKKKSPDELYEILKPFLISSGQNNNMKLPGSLDDAVGIARSEKRFYCFHINKDKALDLLHRIAKSEHTPEEAIQADVLDGLMYFSQKSTVINCLLDKNKIKPKEDLLKNFDKKIDIKHIKCSGGKVTVPFKYSWEDLLEKIELFTNFRAGEVIAREEQEKIEDLIRQYFLGDKNAVKGKSSQSRKHSKVRRVFSLPTMPSTGSVFCIKRKTPSGGYVWQAAQVHNAYAGFSESFSDQCCELLEVFRKSESVFMLKDRYRSACPKVHLMDAWKEISVPMHLKEKILKLEIMPGQASRRYVRVKLTPDLFKNIIEKPEFIWQDILSNYKVKTETFGDILPDIGVPRKDKNKLGVIKNTEASQEYIVFYYQSESSLPKIEYQYFEATDETLVHS
jgi:CRISPR system subtype II-B RNA-guided endonuclease Cas9/Csx12